MTARGQMYRPIDALLTDGPKSPGRAPERARSTHRARVDAGRSAEGQMSPALRALGRWRGVIVWLLSPSRAQTLLEMQAVKRKCVCNNGGGEDVIYVFSSFFRSITFHMRWCLHGRRKGDGERVLHPHPPTVEKLASLVSPRNEDISETFFLDAF